MCRHHSLGAQLSLGDYDNVEEGLELEKSAIAIRSRDIPCARAHRRTQIGFACATLILIYTNTLYRHLVHQRMPLFQQQAVKGRPCINDDV